MKGIVLAGGTGSRLHPLTLGVSKQLLPIYDKPMIYYPLSILMLAGIREVLIITTPHDQEAFYRLLGDGSKFGISLSYQVQEKPNGLAEAFILGRSFIGSDSVSLVLGDNIFWGHGFTTILQRATKSLGATLFAYRVKDPERFGVVGFDSDGRVTSIEEKPQVPKSSFAVTGLYFYDNRVVDIAADLKPSSRGELEISDINKIYLDAGEVSVELLGRGFAWLDTGTHESLFEASTFVETMEKRQGFKIACLEEIALSHGWLSSEDVQARAEELMGTGYGGYLQELAEVKN